jgi:hypothetical protein
MKLHTLKHTAARYDAEHPLAVELVVTTLAILVGLFGAQAAVSYWLREIVVDPAVTDSFVDATTGEQRAQFERDLAATLQWMRRRTVDSASVLFTPTRVGVVDCDRPLSLKLNWSLEFHFGCDYHSSKGERRSWRGILTWNEWYADSAQWREARCDLTAKQKQDGQLISVTRGCRRP